MKLLLVFFTIVCLLYSDSLIVGNISVGIRKHNLDLIFKYVTINLCYINVNPSELRSTNL